MAQLVKLNKAKEIYTGDIVVDMVKRYTAVEGYENQAVIVAELAEELGTSVHSIRAKLGKEGVYQAKIRKSKDGSTVITKGALVDLIDEVGSLALTESEAMSLEKGTKTMLKKLLAALDQ